MFASIPPCPKVGAKEAEISSLKIAFENILI
jgi:hypothetical protein